MSLLDDPPVLVTVSQSENMVGLWRASIELEEPDHGHGHGDADADADADADGDVDADGKVNDNDDGDGDDAGTGASNDEAGAAEAAPRGDDASGATGATSQADGAAASAETPSDAKTGEVAEKSALSRLQAVLHRTRVHSVVMAASQAAVRNDQIGEKLGMLDAKRLSVSSQWSMPQRRQHQQKKELRAATKLLGTEYFTLNKFASEDNRSSSKTDVSELIERVSQPHGTLRKEGRVEEPVSPKQAKSGEIRGAILGQMYGMRTWKETAIEESWNDTLEAERRSQEEKIRQQQRRRDAVLRHASKDAREVAEYSELLDTDLEHHKMVRPTIRSSLPVPWLPATDSENWGINSLNRQKRMYSNLFDTKRSSSRSPKGKGKGKGTGKGRVVLSLNEKIEWAPSPFLEGQFQKREQFEKERRKPKPKPRREQKKPRKKAARSQAAPAKEKEMTEEERIAAAIAAMDAKFAAFASSNDTDAPADASASGGAGAGATTDAAGKNSGSSESGDAIDTAIASH